MAQDKKNIVSETVDKKIDSLSLAFSFVTLGVLLTAIPIFLGNEIVTSAVRWVFVVLGVAGFFSSFGGKESEIKGTGDLAAGVCIFAFAVFCFTCIPTPLNGIFALILLLFGVYAIIRGLLYLIYTTKNAYSSTDENAAPDSKKNVISVIELLTKIAALVLVIVQLIKLST